MLHRRQRHIRQITPTSLALRGLTLTALWQIEQFVILTARSVLGSCVANI